jgi:hypothetical protein
MLLLLLLLLLQPPPPPPLPPLDFPDISEKLQITGIRLLARTPFESSVYVCSAHSAILSPMCGAVQCARLGWLCCK